MGFVNDPKYKDTNIWDLKYISTSDDEDNDSEGDDDIAASDSDEEEGEDEQEEMLSEAEQVNKMADKKLFLKNVEGQGNKVPEIVKQLKPTKQKRARVRYQMTYKTENGELVGEEGKRSLVLKKRAERAGPKDLINLLTREKKALWDREQAMKLLREQDEAELEKLVEEFHSDEDDEEENFAWYDLRDKDTYFCLGTLNKHGYKKDN